MSPTPTLADAMNVPARLRNLVQAPRPVITFTLTTKKNYYTTLDRIEGIVTIVAPVDTNFDSVEIEFIGTSRTFVERLTTAAAASGRSEAYQTFLRLSQPGLEGLYPENLVLKAGQAYKFPFVFAVPEQLLPRICQHKVKNETVRQAHLRLPPTFGDHELGARSVDNQDDFAPDMSSIRYGIFAKVTELRVHKDNVWRSTICSKARRVRVIPAVEEQPPLDVHEEEGEYLMRRERSIRKSLFKGKTGTLVMEAVQPSALSLRSYNNPESKASTTATLMLRYDPVDEASPLPKLGTLASKLKIATYYASTARTALPVKNAAMLELAAGVHCEQLTLSSRCMANVEWTRHEPSKASSAVSTERRDSANSTSSLELGSIPEPSSKYTGGAYYTARLVVPIALPSNKNFPPTFHSCLISRIYVLKFDLGISTSGIAPKMEIKLPVQVTSDHLLNDDTRRGGSVDSGTSMDADVDSEDVSSFFEPRMMRLPSEGHIGRSRIGSQAPVDDAPPGYSGIPLPTSAGPSYGRSRRMASVPVY